MPRVVTFSPISPACTRKPRSAELIVQLGVDEMDLAQVRLGRVAANPGAVLHRGAGVGVTLHPVPCDEPDAQARPLAEGVAADWR